MCFWLTTGRFTGYDAGDDILAEAGGERTATPTPGLRFRLGADEYNGRKPKV